MHISENRKTWKPDAMPFGAVYLIEPGVSAKEKERDFHNMKSLGFDTVVFWPSVSRWDGSPPGETAFASIDESMDLCAKVGLKVILELQGQNRSNQEAPEYYRLPEGAEDINHPEYRLMTNRYLEEVASHFKGHPALFAYDVFNEVTHASKDPWTIREFIGFLRKQYNNDIQALNRAWGTYLTGFDAIAQMSTDFNDMYLLWLSVLPKRDWLRFRPQNFADRLKDWCDVIRRIDPDVTLLADVLGCDTINNRAHDDCFGVTDWKIAEQVDVLGLSCWGQVLGAQWKKQDVFRWPQFWRNALSAARGKRVMISELMTQNDIMFPNDGSSLTDQIRLWSYQALFHGIKGLIYWKYRPFRRGIQVGGRGLTRFSGEPNEHAHQAAEVAQFKSRHVSALNDATPDSAGCAILHDHNAQDIYQSIQPHRPDFYTEAHGGMFRAFWDYGVCPSYVLPQDLAQGVPQSIKVLVIPCNVSLSESTAAVILQFIQDGGILFTEGRFGLLDEDANLWPRVPGGGLHQSFGVEESNFTACFTDEIQLDGVVLKFENDYFQDLDLVNDVNIDLRTPTGKPLLVSRSVGLGKYIHAPFLLSHKLWKNTAGSSEVFARVFAMIDGSLSPAIPVREKPCGVDVSVLLRSNGKPLLAGITNFNHEASTIRLVWPVKPSSVEGDERTKIQQNGDDLLITVPPRRAAAVFL